MNDHKIVETGDVVRFIPLFRKNHVTVLVTSVQQPSDPEISFINGWRCTKEGVRDSQAGLNWWPIGPSTKVTVIA